MSILYLEISGDSRQANQRYLLAGDMSQLGGDIGKGEEVEAVFFDFKKAFDTVPHEALLRKLDEIQLNGILIRWIRSYLTDRMQ